MSDEPQRLTPTQRLHEVTMQALVRQPSLPEHSVELTRNAKGDTQIAVTSRGSDLAEVGAACQVEYERLRRSYPHSNENGGQA